MGISQQCFGIIPKIREVDDYMTPELQGRVVEVHPELVFYEMSGGKSVKEGKKSKGGLAHRLELLAEAFDFNASGASGESPELESGSGRYRGRNGRVLDRGAHFERGRGPRAQRARSGFERVADGKSCASLLQSYSPAIVSASHAVNSG